MITLVSRHSHVGHEEPAFVLSSLFVDGMFFPDISGSFSLEVVFTHG